MSATAPHGRRSFAIVGGAGFIGSHFTSRLLATESVDRVRIYDNFSSGREWHLDAHRRDSRLEVIRADAKDVAGLRAALDGSDTVIHLASNPDIARAAIDPDVDFIEGTLLTRNVLEAMRTTSAKRIIYASGSGVYGDLGEVEAHEDHGPLRPISTYGASKLAGEAMISAYAQMFDMTGCIFRFGNVVGARQTHGVGFDFVRRLLADPTHLRILGDGTQSKSYIDVTDIVAAVLLADEQSRERVTTCNVATGDYITVQEIATLAVEVVGLPPGQTDFEYSREARGWKGDVPVVRLNTERIRAFGWTNRFSSREALHRSMAAVLVDARAGRL